VILAPEPRCAADTAGAVVGWARSWTAKRGCLTPLLHSGLRVVPGAPAVLSTGRRRQLAHCLWWSLAGARPASHARQRRS